MANLELSGQPSTGVARLEEFWRGRRVFLTGHTGFKGGWLTALLHRLGAEVTGYALAPEPGLSLFEMARIGELAQASHFADIRDGAALTAALWAARPSIVLHLAAQALVGRARAEPAETFDTNVMGTVRLLDAVRATPGVEAMVVVTSDKVYDNVEWPWAYRETDRLGGKEPYGASKAACEIVLQAYRHSYFSGERKVPIVSARAGNVIGGGDWAADRLIPDAIRAFADGQPLIARNPAAVRPWQHVLEPLAGYLRLAQALTAGLEIPEGGGLNFGPTAEDAWPVARVIDAVAARWGEGAAWRQDPGAQPYEARLLEVDSARARGLLGWTPKWRLEAGLDRTVDWYRAVHGGEDPRAVTLRQIEEHLNG